MLRAVRHGHYGLVDVLVGQFGCSLTDVTSVSDVSSHTLYI